MSKQADKQQTRVNDVSEKDEQGGSMFLQERLQMHRDYISRQWQYFATGILLNGLLVNAIKDLNTATPLLLAMLGIASMTTSGVFFHLINWTDMRIDRNARKINELAKQNLIEIPTTFEGITVFLLGSTALFAVCWLFWLLQVRLWSSFVGSSLFLLIAVSSFISTRKWRKRTLV